LGIINVDFNAAYQLLITYSAFVKYFKKWEYNEAVHQLFIYFKKDYDSVSRTVLCNIFIEFSITMELARLIKMCLNESYGTVPVSKHLSDTSCIKNGLK